MDVPAPPQKVAHDRACIILRRRDLYFHNRFKQHATAFFQRLAARAPPSKLKSKDRGIDVMIFPVDQRRLDVDNRETGKNSRAQNTFDAFLDAGYVLPRHCAAYDLRLEARALPRLIGLKDDFDLGELTRSAGLFLVGI